MCELLYIHGHLWTTIISTGTPHLIYLDPYECINYLCMSSVVCTFMYVCTPPYHTFCTNCLFFGSHFAVDFDLVRCLAARALEMDRSERGLGLRELE